MLGRAIQDRFPKYYHYFSTRTFAFRGKEMRNHNHLLGRVAGVDGIKTGYIHDSGFNIVISMHRGPRHIVAVVFGGRTAVARDARVRQPDRQQHQYRRRPNAPRRRSSRAAETAEARAKDGQGKSRVGFAAAASRRAARSAPPIRSSPIR